MLAPTAHTEVAISTTTWEAVHQQGNQELHEKQEEAMILGVPSCLGGGGGGGGVARRARLCCSQHQCRC